VPNGGRAAPLDRVVLSAGDAGSAVATSRRADSFGLFTGIQPDAGRTFQHLATLVGGAGSDVDVG
jgi:hypothetical protein